MPGRTKILTATGHIVSHAGYLNVIAWSGAGGAQGRAGFYNAKTAASATTTNEIWRVEAGVGAGASDTTWSMSFPFDAKPEFADAIYCVISNLNNVCVAYEDGYR